MRAVRILRQRPPAEVRLVGLSRSCSLASAGAIGPEDSEAQAVPEPHAARGGKAGARAQGVHHRPPCSVRVRIESHWQWREQGRCQTVVMEAYGNWGGGPDSAVCHGSKRCGSRHPRRPGRPGDEQDDRRDDESGATRPLRRARETPPASSSSKQVARASASGMASRAASNAASGAERRGRRPGWCPRVYTDREPAGAYAGQWPHVSPAMTGSRRLGMGRQ